MRAKPQLYLTSPRWAICDAVQIKQFDVGMASIYRLIVRVLQSSGTSIPTYNFHVSRPLPTRRCPCSAYCSACLRPVHGTSSADSASAVALYLSHLCYYIPRSPRPLWPLISTLTPCESGRQASGEQHTVPQGKLRQHTHHPLIVTELRWCKGTGNSIRSQPYISRPLRGRHWIVRSLLFPIQ